MPTSSDSFEADPTRRALLGLAAAGAAGVAAGCDVAAGPASGAGDGAAASRGARLPTLYIPHGAGPCFFMDWELGPRDTWDAMAAWLRGLGERLSTPEALLVVSAHWEESIVTVQSAPKPPLLFDYYGFPRHTYELTWPAPGAPALAARVRGLLDAAGIPNAENAQRGFDHGTFVPLKVAYPEARIPTAQLSLDASLDPAAHLALGRALAPLRDEGVLILGSGLSFHNMRAFKGGGALDRSIEFDAWLEGACTGVPGGREAALARWADAPSGRFAHPREEHLLPLMVAVGAAQGEPGRRIFAGEVMGVRVSAFEFGA